MFDIILLAYLSYRNGMMAKIKEQNPIAWAFYTVIAFFVASMIGSVIVLLYFCKNINITQFTTLKRDAQMQQLQQAFENNPLDSITILLFGFGGYLLVRYLLERKPGKDKPEVNNELI